MSSKNKREADKIIRESLKGTQQNFQMPQLQMQPFAPMTPMGMPFPMGPFGFPASIPSSLTKINISLSKQEETMGRALIATNQAT